MNLSNLVDKFTDCEWFQRLASEFISSRIQINFREDDDKAACHFTASVTSAYNLSTSKLNKDLNKDLPGLESLLKHERRLKKLWQATWDPVCKTAVNCVVKTIG
jgi:hypothetical protein